MKVALSALKNNKMKDLNFLVLFNVVDGNEIIQFKTIVVVK